MRSLARFLWSRSRAALLLASMAAALLFAALPLLLLLGPAREVRAQSAPPAAPTATPPPNDQQNANRLDDIWEAAHGFELPAFRYNALAGWWLFDDGTATDKGPFHLDGTLYGFVPLTLSPPQSPFVEGGLFYGALAFDEQAYVLFDPAHGPDLSAGSFTVSAWFKAPAPAANTTPNPSVIARWVGTNGATWELGVDERSAAYLDLTGPAAGASTYRVDKVSAPTVVRDGAWHHLAGVYDGVGATATLYVAGAQEAAATIPGGWTGSAASAFSLGYPGAAVALAPNAPFTLDEVRLYNQALAAGDIKRLPPTFYDLDGDGLSTLAEMQAGTDPNAADSDGDGTPDGVDAYPRDFYNAALPTLTVAGGDGQSGPKGAFLPQALTVRVAGANGQALANAPVVFTVAGGDDARLALAAGATPPPAGAAGAGISVRTDASGLARVSLYLPADTGLTAHRINATVSVSGGQAVAVAFTIYVQSVAPVSDGLSLWLAADLGVSADAAGHVSAWTDLSGAQNSAVQADANSQPQWLANQVGGSRPALRFDGNSGRLVVPNSPGTDNFTIFTVVRATTPHEIDAESAGSTSGVSGQRYLFGAHQSGADGGAGVSVGTNGVSVYEHGDSYLSPLAVYAGALEGFHSVAVRYAAKQPQILVNGAPVRTGLTSQRPHVHAPTEIGAGSYGAFPGDVAEVLVYNRALTDAECAQVEGYLNAKYAYNPPPGAPARLNAVPLSATQVALSWIPGAGGGSVTAYTLERQANGGAWTTLATPGGSTTSYLDAGLSAGVTYAYRLTAANSTGSSPASVTVTTTTLASGGAMPLAGLALWLRSDAGVSLDAAGLVSAWADQAGGSHDALQGDAGRRPVLVGAALNGQPAVRFNGSSTFLQTAGFDPFGNSTVADYSVFLVTRPGATQPDYADILDYDHGGGYGFVVQQDGGATNHFYFNGASTVDLGRDGRVRLVSVVKAGTTQSAFTEGTHAADGTLAATQPGYAPRALAVGGKANAGYPRFYNGDVAEVLLYNRALSDAERQAVEVYLNAKYAVVTLPAPPTGLSAGVVSATQANVFWNVAPGTAAQVQGYHVERRDVAAGGAFAEVAAVAGGGVQAFLDEGLTPGASYAYRLRAYNLAGVSAYSAEVNVGLPVASSATATLPATDSLALWLRADAGTGMDATGRVSAWTDASGHGNNAAQLIMANRPQLVAGGPEFNNQPALHFDGVSSFLSLAPGLDDFDSGLTALVVLKPTNVVNWQDFLDFGNGGQTDNIRLARYDGSARLYYQTLTGGSYVNYLGADNAIEQGVVQLFEFGQDPGSTAWLRKNSRLLAQGGAGGIVRVMRSRSTLGCNPDFGGYFGGDIAEVVVFDRALTDAERQGWEAYLNRKYQYDPPPPAPTELSASALSANQVALSWTDDYARISGYLVERQTAGGAWTTLATLGADATSYVDGTTVAGGQYAYRVTANNSTGASPASEAVTAAAPTGGGSLPLGNLRLWLKGDSGVGRDENGFVDRWLDRSGRGLTARQGNQANKPRRVPAILNGKPVVRFNGTAAEMDLPAFMAAGATEGEVVIVHRATPDPVNPGNQGWHDLGTDYGYNVKQYPAADGRIYDATGSTSRHDTGRSALPLDRFHLYDVTSTPGEWTSRINGIVHGRTAVNAVGFAAGGRLGVSSYYNNHFAGDVAEVMVFDRALTSLEREALGRYLNAKYAFLTPAGTPANLRAAAFSPTQVTLSWTEPVTGGGAVVYSLERRDATGSFSVVAETQDATSLVDSGLLPGTAYTYRVSARNLAGDTGYSGEVGVTTPPPNAGVALPADGLRLWLAADGGAAADGFSVWSDASGHGNHAQPTASQASVAAAVANGRPAAHFDGHNGTVMNLPNLMDGATEGELFIVHRATADPADPTVQGWHDFGSDYGYGVKQYADAGGRIYDSFGSTARKNTGAPVLPLDQFHLYNVTSRPGEWVSRLNGGLHYRTTDNAVGFSPSPKLGVNSYYNYRFGGDVAEVLIYGRALSATEREAVGRYLAAKYALVSTPAVPADGAALAVSPTQASLTWTEAANGGGAVTYQIERKLADSTDAFAAVAEVTDATGFLDSGLTPGAAYVYRVTARTYGGSSVPSQEFSVTVPATGAGAAAMPTGGLRLWLRADAGVGADGLNTWEDQSGQGNHAWQGSAMNRPTLVPDALHGRPALRFDGAVSEMNLPDFMHGATEGEMLVVHRSTAPTGVERGWHDLGADYPYYMKVFPGSDGQVYDAFGSTTRKATGAPAQSLKSFHLYDVSSRPGEWVSRVNGLLHYRTTDNAVGFPSSPRLGVNGAYNYHFQGDVAEILVYDHALTAPEREAVGRYLNDRYALVAVPAAPSALGVTALSATQASLAWTAPATEAMTLFEVERKADGDANFSRVADVAQGDSYIDSGLTAGITYRYRVRARNYAGRSARSGEVVVAMPATGTDLPTDALKLWLKADAGTAATRAANWVDQSGNANHAHQNAAEREPLVLADAANGRPTLRFDGVNSEMGLPNFMDGFTAGELFIVQRAAASPNGPWGQGAHDLGADYAYYAKYYPGGDGRIYDNFGTTGRKDTGSPALPLDQLHLYNVTSRAGEWTSRINGFLHFTTAVNTVGFPAAARLGVNGAYNSHFSGDVAEMLIFNRPLAGAERETVNRYLLTKYALATAPPVPLEPAARVVSPTQANLTWSGANGTTSTVYTVERQGPDGVYVVVAQVTDATSYLDTGLQAGTAYRYRISARNAAGTSDYSAEFSLTASTPSAVAAVAMPMTGLQLWLRADAGTNADGLNTWQDQSGLGNHARQGSTANRPTLVPLAANGRPAVHFDGATSELGLPNFLSGAAEGEFFIVHRSTAAPGVVNGWHDFGASYPYAGFFYPNSDGRIYDDFGSTGRKDTGDPAVALDQFHLYNVVSRPGEWTSRLNGFLHFTTTDNVVGFEASPRLGVTGAYNWHFAGDVAEVLIYDHALSGPEREAVGRYLAGKYSLFTAPAAPTGGAVLAVSPSQVSLTWNGVGEGAVSGSTIYTVERKGPGDVAFRVVAEVTDATGFFDAGLTAGGTYTYRVTARNAAGASAPSQEFSVSVPAADAGAALPTDRLRLWLRADAGTNADGLNTWADQSGRGNHARQNNGSNQPAVVQSAVNGRPAVHFDGASSEMGLPDFMANATEGEFFIVHRSTAAAGSDNGWHDFGASYPYAGFFYPYRDGRIYDDSGSDVRKDTGAPGIRLDRFHLYDVASRLGEWTSRLNGFLHFTTKSNTVNFEHSPRLGVTGAYNWHFAGDVAEILAFDRVLNGAEREAVGRYLNARYAVESVPAAPAAPVHSGTPGALALSTAQISLTWSQPGVNAGNGSIIYALERQGPADASFLPLAEVIDSTSYLDVGLSSGATYRYRLRARNLAGQSGYSPVFSASTPADSLDVGVPTTALRLWLKADGGFTADGANTWADQSGRGNHARQGNAANQPTLVADALNGRPAVHFDGSTSELGLPSGLMANAAEGELFIVHRSTAPVGTDNGWHDLGASYPYAGFFYPFSNGRIYDNFGSDVRKDPPGKPLQPLTEFHLYDASSRPGQWTSRPNGETAYTTSNNTVGFSSNPRLGVTGAYNWHFAGDVAEVLMFERALQPAERHSVERYLAAKYLIPGYDSDGDGLTNAQEQAVGANPFDVDTNHDGLWDGVSLALGINPAGPGTTAYTGIPNPSPSPVNPPPPDPNDHSLPVITLLQPAGAVPVP